MCNFPREVLSSVTATGTGPVVDLGSSVYRHSLIVSSVGSPDSAYVVVRGSHDGATWVSLVEAQTDSGSSVGVATREFAVRYLQADLVILSGGSSPAVTASVASV